MVASTVYLVTDITRFLVIKRNNLLLPYNPKQWHTQCTFNWNNLFNKTAKVNWLTIYFALWPETQSFCLAQHASNRKEHSSTLAQNKIQDNARTHTLRTIKLRNLLLPGRKAVCKLFLCHQFFIDSKPHMSQCIISKLTVKKQTVSSQHKRCKTKIKGIQRKMFMSPHKTTGWHQQRNNEGHTARCLTRKPWRKHLIKVRRING
jgi:hypothetical protein